jgi:hypothetical protein
MYNISIQIGIPMLRTQLSCKYATQLYVITLPLPISTGKQKNLKDIILSWN